MNVVALEALFRQLEASASYRGSTIQRGLAGSAARATLSDGGFMWATAPFAVSLTTCPNTASVEKLRITSIDLFFKPTGRASGMTRPLAGSTRVSSSDNRRQPRLIRPAHNVLLPDPGGAGSISAAPSLSTTAACMVRY